MLVVDSQHCTGCGACIQICPQHCISWEHGELGHTIPNINITHCINCEACVKVCPINQAVNEPQGQRFYAAVHKDIAVLNRSTSGGFFTAIARSVLRQNGIVYGCAYEDTFQVHHIRVQREEDLEQLSGSKYVQSDTLNTFAAAKRDLLAGKQVLYSGTPCQIAGLKSYLGHEYEDLLTVDIICHGVGSQAFFDKYMDFLSKRENGVIKELHFRRKDFAGWSCGGVVVVVDSLNKPSKAIKKPFYDYNNYYYYDFLHGDIYRESCYTCKYASTNRPGDFTMGDFWGVESYNLPLDTQNGCSLVIANTEKAQKQLAGLQDQMDFVEVTKEQAVKANGQLSHPSRLTPARECLARQFETMDGAQIDEAFRRESRKQIAKLHLKAMVPYRMKVIMRKRRR